MGVLLATWLGVSWLSGNLRFRRSQITRSPDQPITRYSTLLVILLAALSFSTPCYAQGTLMQLPPLTTSLGTPIAGATINVFTTTGNLPTLVCAAPVTVYKDVALTLPFTTLTTDGAGNYPFFISPSANPYGLTVSGAGTATSQCYGFSAPVPPLSSPTFLGVTTGTLTVTGNSLFGGTLIGNTATVNHHCNPATQIGGDIGAQINACLALGNGTDIEVSTSGTITTQILINNLNFVRIHGIGDSGITLTNGIVGNPAQCAIKITGNTNSFHMDNLLIQGNSLTGAGGNGNAICVNGIGGSPNKVHIDHVRVFGHFGNGVDGTGASMPAAGLYAYQSIDIHADHNWFIGNQQGAVLDTAVNVAQLEWNEISQNPKFGVVVKGSSSQVEIGPKNDIEQNGTLTTDNWLLMSACQQCSYHGNWAEANNGYAFITNSSNNCQVDVYQNTFSHGGVPSLSPNANWIIDTGGACSLDIHDNKFASVISLTAFIDLNPSGGANDYKLINNNIFELFSPKTITNAINFQGGGTQTGPCVIQGNDFGNSSNTQYFAGTTAVDVSNATGCRVSHNSCFTNSGTLSNCVKVEATATNTIVESTTTSGAGTITNPYSDSGTGTICIGAGCPFPLSIGGLKVPQVVASGTASMTTALIATVACGTTVTVAATGVLTSDVINTDFNAAVTAANNGLLTPHAWPTAGNVNFNYCNPTAAGQTPTAMTVNWSVVR